MKLAITGGAGEGKSTVLSYVREAGVPVASADEIAAQVFELPEIQRALAELLEKQTPVARPELGDAVFGDARLRRQVNALMHPAIAARMRADPAPVMEVPLLFEACLQRHFERIWVVTCGPEEQLRRLSERLGSEARARRILESQLSTRVKCAFADRIIRTISNPSDVRSYVLDSLGADLGDCLARS